MTDVANLALRADSREVRRATDDLRRFGDSAGMAEGRTRRATDSIGEMGKAARVVGGIVAAALSVRQIQRYADTWSDLTSRIQLSIGAQGNAADVMSRLAGIARMTYSPLEETAEIFARNAVTLNALGKATEQQLDFTEALNNALVVSGAKGQSLEMVQNSLAKAMATGTLRGQELDTVLNRGTRVAEALAAELGVNVTQLRSLAADGKITGDVIFNSMTKNMEQLRKEAESMPATIGDAFTLISNSLLQAVGQFDAATGSSEGLATRLISVADAIGPIARVITEVSVIARDQSNEIAASFGFIEDGAHELAGGLNHFGLFATAFVGTLGDVFNLGFRTIGSGFQALGATLGAGAAQLMLVLRGEFEIARKVGSEWSDDIQKIFSILANTDTSTFRDRLGEISYGFGSIEKRSRTALDPLPKILEMTAKEAKAAAKELKAFRAAAQGIFDDNLRSESSAVASLQAKRDEITLLDRQLELMGRGTSAEKARAQAIRESLELEVARQRAMGNPLGASTAQAQIGVNEREQRVSDLSRFGNDPMKAITGSVPPLSGGAFDDQLARYAAEAEFEKKRHAETLERFREARQLQIDLGMEYNAAEEQLQKTHADRMAQIEQAKMATVLSAAQQGFGGIAELLRVSVGEQSDAYKAMFAVSQGFAIAQAALNLSSAVMQVLAAPDALTPIQKFANVAAVAAAGGALATQVASISYGGGRQNGGPVSAGSMYRVNEGGMPEMFQAANGEQYMLPTTRGEVISNRDAKGGAPVVNVSIVNNGPPMRESSRTMDGDNVKLVLDLVENRFAESMSSNQGKFVKSMSGNFNMSRRTR